VSSPAASAAEDRPRRRIEREGEPPERALRDEEDRHAGERKHFAGQFEREREPASTA
jgi:hypothetical protein